jgi:prepilin-type N-terminal cleavage/methylation domain-containing protein
VVGNARHHGFTMIELLIVIVILAILAAIAIPLFMSQRDKARDSALRSGIHQIEVGIMSYATDHNDIYPAAVTSQSDLIDDHGEPYIHPWPTNKWTGVDMKADPSARGDFVYTQTAAGFTLAGHLSTGEFVVP